MSKIRSKRVRAPLIIGLCVCLLGPALVLSNPGLTGAGQYPPQVGVDKTADETEGAASLTGEVLTIEAALAYARHHNPAIGAARSRVQAAQKVPAQASAYEDPMLSWESWNAPENFRLNEANNNIFRLSQKIPFPGKLRLKGEIASKEAERMQAGLRATEIDTVAQLKKAYWSYPGLVDSCECANAGIGTAPP